MKKSDREIVFNKFGGKCAYCGTNLVKGWHVDHLVPIRRNYEYQKGYFAHQGTPSVRWRNPRTIIIGCENPEMECIENYMPACASCNINKHDMSLERFRKLIKTFIESLNSYSTQYKIAKRYGLITETNIEVEFYFEKLIKNNYE